MNEPFVAPMTPRSGHRRVDSGRGLAWLTEGWGLFVKNPGVWIAIAVVLMIIYGVLSLVPVLGQIAAHLLAPIFAAGLLLGCRSLANGGDISLEHLFAGFRQNSGKLVMVGVFYLVGAFLAMMIALFAGGGMAMASGMLGMGGGLKGMMVAGMFGGMLFMLLIFLLLSMPLVMAFWFAPALVLFREMEPLPAMLESFSACLVNTMPFLVYGVFGLILLVLAAIPLGLGFLVAIPVLAGSFYVSYVDIFE
ncbi:MAG: BPSS1780 family membrane protein [Rhodocyclaceae bacterium]|nr:BPSS1780 family membrane protein [Rhodocyclaceae bacterium]